MSEPEVPAVPPQPPLAIYHTRVDDKGRLRLNKDFENYLRSFPQQVFFVTTLDGYVARIYPIATWRENLQLIEDSQEGADVLEDIAFSARAYGAESPLDKDGRILIPPLLRRKLGIENQPVWVGYFKGALEVYSEAYFQEKMQRAAMDSREKLKVARKLGFK